MLDTNYWHQKWKTSDIGFHQIEANPLLVRYFKELSLAVGSRIFLPLCGKTLDISWLLKNGYKVVGVELSKLAIEQLFDDLQIKPKISSFGKMLHYQAENIDIFAGDIFSLSSEKVGYIDAVYDRAALVALTHETRKLYTKQIMKLTKKAPQLLICYEYDQGEMDGPPFSIGDKEVKQHYGEFYKLKLLGVGSVDGGLKSVCEADEKVWLLSK